MHASSFKIAPRLANGSESRWTRPLRGGARAPCEVRAPSNHRSRAYDHPTEAYASAAAPADGVAPARGGADGGASHPPGRAAAVPAARAKAVEEHAVGHAISDPATMTSPPEAPTMSTPTTSRMRGACTSICRTTTLPEFDPADAAGGGQHRPVQMVDEEQAERMVFPYDQDDETQLCGLLDKASRPCSRWYRQKRENADDLSTSTSRASRCSNRPHAARSAGCPEATRARTRTKSRLPTAMWTCSPLQRSTRSPSWRRRRRLRRPRGKNAKA